MRRNKNVPEEAGYEYALPSGEQMVEFHVNYCKSFSTEMNATTKFGGELSSLFINAPTTLIDKWKKDGIFEEENEPSKAGFEYVSLIGVLLMIEIHALHFKDYDATRNKLKQSIHDHALFFNFSGHNPLLLFVQGEETFKQFIMTLNIWLGRG